MSVSSDAPRPISLARRFAWATAARLLLLTALLAAVVMVSVREPTLTSFSVRAAMWTLALAFAVSGVYAWFLRARRYLRGLVTAQLVIDQLIWTIVVYLAGGIASGATSFYGVSCFFGALLGGYRGAFTAAAAAAVCYSTLVALLLTEVLPIPPDQPASAYSMAARDVVYSGMANALMLVAVVLLAGALTERLRATGGQLARAEARVQQAESEARLGRLAAGLAHEIRNPLGAISGSVTLLASNSGLADDEKELCRIIQREAERLNDLVSDMLDLANPRVARLSEVDVARIAQEVVQLANNSGRGGTDVRIKARGEQSLTTRADGAMLRQMLWNLVRNAVQASNPDDCVVVSVEVEEDTVVVEVADHGVGLSAEAESQIFDPFFTTRSKGTGVGLAVVKRIVDQHGWSIEVKDTPGGDATFSVCAGATSGSQQSAQPRSWTLFPPMRT